MSAPADVALTEAEIQRCERMLADAAAQLADLSDEQLEELERVLATEAAEAAFTGDDQRLAAFEIELQNVRLALLDRAWRGAP